MNKQQLASTIWESANRMRSKIEANEYKDYILGFIFYKYLSDREIQWLHANDYTDDIIPEYVNEKDIDTVENVQQSLGYFIAYENLFSTWINMGSDFSVDNVRTALSSFTRLISRSHKKVFEGIFNTLETGLSKLGENAKAQTKAVRDLIQLIDKIPMNGKQDYDVLGFIYEYLISNFAANAGKKAGEFYTPHEVSVLMSEIIAHHLQGRETVKIYDPTSGSGSLLITIGNALAKYMNNPNGIRYYAQELKANTYNLTRMNLVMRGILPDNIVTRNGDTLEEDWPYFDEDDPIGTYQPLYVDAVVSNPPYSQRWDPSGKENDPRYSRYGLAPKSKADYAFLLHDLYHLKPDGIMTIVLPHGVLFRGGEEGEIRKNLIEQNNIDAIIGLPANIFFGTGIPTIIMVLQQKRENTDVLIVDASKGFTKEGKNNKLRASDIRRIVDTVTGRLDIPKYSRKVSKEEIRANDYNLNIPRYVDSSESTESWDIYASMFGGIPESELNDLDQYWKEFPSLKNDLFESNGKYAQIKATDIKEAIMNNTDVQSYLNQFHESFSDMTDYLSEMLIDNAENVPIIKTEDQITEDIFCRFENIHLVDKYEAFEIFHDAYTGISGDLELIQAEGMKAVRQVDPNMVVKKKNGRDAEVQEGWKGHILPFDLIQHKLMKPELDVIDKEEERIQEIPGEYESILGEMSEDDKEIISDALNDSNDEFVLKNVASMIRTLKKEDAVENKELIQILQKVSDLSVEEKKLKAKIKKEKEELHLATKARIENLTDEELTALLQSKWIQPITEGINSLPDKQLDELVKAVKKLADKYKDTFDDIETEIRKTEASLSEMLSELQGTKEDMAGIREFQKLLGGGE
ncbi:MAG: type I restriction-modification system subunit M [Bilifractor sp.]|jgi:type I restriction enzyme M protein